MQVAAVVSTILPLAMLALVGWAILRFGRSNSGENQLDAAAMVRRFFLYGLLYVTVLVTAQGLVELSAEWLGEGSRSTAAIAQALAFLVVGVPAGSALAYYVDRRLQDRPEERGTVAWTIYLNAALLTTLVGAMMESHTVVRALLDGGDRRSFRVDSMAAAAIWGLLLAGHWFVLRRRHPPAGDLDLAVGTIAGLAPLSIGLAGVLYTAADEIYTAVTDDPVLDRSGPSFSAWAATATVGAATWLWYWVGNYRRSPRSELWYVTVVPIGALAGFVATVSMLATLAYHVVVWFAGEPGSPSAVRHFDVIPSIAGVLVVGVVCWSYHRSQLTVETIRSDAIRAYDYLLALAALVAAVLGSVLLLVAVFDVGQSAVANTVIAGLTLVGLGGPLWYRFWTGIARHVAADRMPELRSPLRRIHLFTILGLGGLADLIGVLAVLTITFEDLLDGTVSRTTLHDNRVALAVVLAVSGVAWYHLQVFRSERADYAPPSPPAPTRRSQRVILVSSGDPEQSRRLAEATGAAVVDWRRTDQSHPSEFDVDHLGRMVTSQVEDDLLVLVDDDGPIVIPFTAASVPPAP